MLQAMRVGSPSRLLLLGLPLLLAAGGCGRRPIVSYRIPKEDEEAIQASPAAAADPHAGLGPNLPPGHPSLAGGANPGDPANLNGSPPAEEAALTWKAPSDWRAGPRSAMRRGSYDLGGGLGVAISAFPGDVGGILANVNRWRGQVGLPPVAEEALGRETQVFDANGLGFTVVDAAGGGQRIVAVLVPWRGETWFFKLTGPESAVGAAKPRFLEFLRTVRAP